MVEAGSVLGIFGPNGSGKTTLLKVIAGLKEPGEGKVELPARNGEWIASLPQDFRASFFEWANLEHNLVLTSSLFPSHPREARRIVRDTASELGLNLDLSLRPVECSGGMLQQAAIIRVFQNSPSLIVADEPFSALDVHVAAAVRSSFRRMVRQKGVAAVVVLHQLQDLADVCDEVLVIPGRPYSTEALTGFEQAIVLENDTLRTTDNEDGAAFVALARKVLGNHPEP
jgi:ABC-type multidrug transport system ATPase subunit